MRKALKWAVALTAAVFLLSGCTGETGSTPESSNSAQSTNAVQNDISSEGTADAGDDSSPAEDGSQEKNGSSSTIENAADETAGSALSALPVYSGDPYVTVNDNEPFFTEEEKQATEAFENYSDLDSLGRCQVAYANICEELMPTEERGNISSVKPTGWHSVKYDFVEGESLYNRCHLIAFQLAGENANEENLITGTRYMNTMGMEPFENMVADYVKETGNHVLYRVTPIFTGDNLIADGVLMEGWSVEDNGEGICYNVYCYNVQPGVIIDYATGDNEAEEVDTSEEETFVMNTNTKKFHLATCESLKEGNSKNRQEATTLREFIVEQGYSPCKTCNP